MRFSQKKFLHFIIRISLLSAIVRVLIDYLPRLLNLSPIVYYLTFFVAFILEVIVIIHTLKKHTKLKGLLTITDALKTGISMMGVIGLSYCTMAFVYDTYIDPDFQTNMMLTFIEQFSPDQVEEAKKNLTNKNIEKSYLGIILYTIWFVFLGSIISMITGSILKTK